MSLVAMLRDPGTGIEEIAAHLDGLDHRGRMAELAPTTRADQRALWQRAHFSAPITLEHLLPSHVRPRVPVAHHGRNTLPLPPANRFFIKQMSRPEDGTPRAFGFNDSAVNRLIGPGYFVVVSTHGRPAWAASGAWVVDYAQHPDGAVPDGWPRVRPNTQGLQRFVFPDTRDFMRRVSAHVSIGAAFKGDKPLDHYFTLCRED